MKQKLEHIMLWWSVTMVLIVSSQIMAGSLLYSNAQAQSVAVSSARPQVLGATTSEARGKKLTTKQQKAVLIENTTVPQVLASSFLVYDQQTSDTLLEKKADEQFPVASLTKLLTALVTYKYGNLEDVVSVSEKDMVSVSPAIHLKYGDKIFVKDLFNSMLIGSSNDSALALSNYIKSVQNKEFVTLMNEESQSLLMTKSRFSNPLGFDSVNNYSTANDLHLLVNETQKLAAFKNLGKRIDYSFKSEQGVFYKIFATNKLVAKYPEIEAVKTGFTPNSKGSLISKITKNGHSIVVIVLGSENREKDTLELTDFVFKNFEWK